jgi:hypothetical protein
MDIEVLGFLGFVFASTAIAKMACEHRKDVLRLRYCEQQNHSARQLWTPSIFDHVRWKTCNLIYLVSI